MVIAFRGDREDALGDRERGGVADRGVGHERADRGEADVAGAGAVAPLVFEVLEEVEHERGVQVLERQRAGAFAGALLGEAEEQLERVTVALDGAGADASLLDQAPQEEVLQQGGEPSAGSVGGTV